VTRLLDEDATLRAAKDDPSGFTDHDGLMVIDEIQLAPELLRAIKVHVDLDPRPGRFLLTGSSRVLALRALPDALPGRMEVIELWPFSQGEMAGGPDRSSTPRSGTVPRLTTRRACAAVTTSNAPSPAGSPKRSAAPRAAGPRSSTPISPRSSSATSSNSPASNAAAISSSSWLFSPGA
jgi:hypothetical protein